VAAWYAALTSGIGSEAKEGAAEEGFGAKQMEAAISANSAPRFEGEFVVTTEESMPKKFKSNARSQTRALQACFILIGRATQQQTIDLTTTHLLPALK
jgi:hypothetical protein